MWTNTIYLFIRNFNLGYQKLSFCSQWALLWYKKELSSDLLHAETQVPVCFHFPIPCVSIGTIFLRTSWHSKQRSAPVSISIFTLICYQILSFNTNHSGSVTGNVYDWKLGTCPSELDGEMLPTIWNFFEAIKHDI